MQVDVSISLSACLDIDVPNEEDLDNEELERYVREQHLLPDDLLELESIHHYYSFKNSDKWIVDDFCVM